VLNRKKTFFPYFGKYPIHFFLCLRFAQMSYSTSKAPNINKTKRKKNRERERGGREKERERE